MDVQFHFAYCLLPLALDVIQVADIYSLHSKINSFKFYPTNSVLLDCSKAHLIKIISNTKKFV